MPLNPRRNSTRPELLFDVPAVNPFQAEAEAAIAGFRATRAAIAEQVRRGDLTVKIAREQAARAAEQLRERVLAKADGYNATPRVFADRLAEADALRARARESTSIEALQRETNRLLRQSLTEQQLQARAGEFEGRAFVRPVTGGPPTPTLSTLLSFHRQADAAGDDAAREWGRRQLEAMRGRVAEPEDQHRIDLACDRPEMVNPRIVHDYVEAMTDRPPADLELFAGEAISFKDANACTAAFVLARQSPEGPSARWVRNLLEGVREFPEAAIRTLRGLEAEACKAETDAIQARVEAVVALAAGEARLEGLQAPTAEQLQRRARIEALPVAGPGEPIGLALSRRGANAEEYAAEAGEEG